MNFAKLFNYPTGQLLVTLTEDYVTEEVCLSFRSDGDECSLETKAKHPDVDTGRAALAAFDEAAAEKMFSGMQMAMGRQ